MNATEGLWQGRDDSAEQGDTRRLFQIVRHDETYASGDAVLCGFASDAGVRRNHGRPGAHGGPTALRRALAGLPAHGLDALWDAGDVVCEGDDLEAAQAAQGRRVADILDRGSRLFVMGGGHEVAWADFQGLREHLYERGEPESGSLLIVNLDAHFDLRSSRPGSSGTPFDQILQDSRERSLPVRYACFGVSRLGNTAGLYEHAQSLGVAYVEDTQMQERDLTQRLHELDDMMRAADHVYLTIDLDVLPASVAPGVSAPAPLGVPLSVVEAFAQHIKDSGKLRLADMAEFNPEFDCDQHTARVAARLAWTLLQP